MKVVHWVFKNGSGMHRVGAELAEAEKAFGVDSIAVDPFVKEEWEKAEGADVYVVHTHFPNELLAKNTKPLVWVGHGTPEYVFQSAVESGLNHGYGASDPWMIALYWLQRADVAVTFWERHKWIWQNLCPKQRIEVVPMGIDSKKWHPVESRGKYAGTPSVFEAENCHYIKWPLDILYAWPEVCKTLPEAKLHIVYLPRDQHRWFFPLMNMNGAAFNAYITGDILDVDNLKNAFCSTDYYLNMVRYGDHDRVGLEAAACGAKVISYKGNPYAHYWLEEGDQRKIVEDLIKILSGKYEPVEAPLPSPTIEEMVAKTTEIYGSLV